MTSLSFSYDIRKLFKDNIQGTRSLLTTLIDGKNLGQQFDSKERRDLYQDANIRHNTPQIEEINLQSWANSQFDSAIEKIQNTLKTKPQL